MRRPARATLMLATLAALVGGAAVAAGPANDTIAGATEVAALPATLQQEIFDAALEPDEPVACGMQHTVWFRFTAPADTTVAADTFGSDFDTVLGAYAGTTLEDLEPLGCNDQAGGSQSALAFGVRAGHTYLLQAGGFPYSPEADTLVLNLATIDPPANDGAAAAIALPFPARAAGSNEGATVEPGEPRACAGLGATVWYLFTAPDGLPVAVRTFGSDFDTVLAVHAVESDGLRQVACNDDAAGLSSAVTIQPRPGASYLVQVGGYAGAQGSIELTIRTGATTTVPHPLGGSQTVVAETEDGRLVACVETTCTGTRP